MHVATKTIEKEWIWNPSKVLHIKGENANIVVKAWEERTIKSTIEFIAKHPDKNRASSDLKTLKATLENKVKIYELSNQLAIENGMEKPVSMLKVKYTIYVPKKCALLIKNRFGSIEIVGLQNKVQINSQFTKLDLKEVKGEIELVTNFGDIIGEQLTGAVHIDANRSDIQLNHPSGNFRVKTKYGRVTILEDKDRFFDLDIKGNKANVLFLKPILIAHNFKLATEYGEIEVPEFSNFRFIENSKSRKEVILQKTNIASLISVNLFYGDITFQ